MKKLTNEQLGRITKVLNKGRDSWNNAYGIFRPMKEWKSREWLQYIIICINFIAGTFVIAGFITEAVSYFIDGFNKDFGNYDDDEEDEEDTDDDIEKWIHE